MAGRSINGWSLIGGVGALLGKLTPFAVREWGRSSDMEGGFDPDPERPVADLADAQVISSLIKEPRKYGDPGRLADELLTGDHGPWGLAPAHGEERRHMVVLDIDYPVHVVPSSTPGHNHLYIEVPNGIPTQPYFAMVKAMADAHVVQPGYYDVSLNRGHTDVRLPWVQKGDPLPTEAPVGEPLPPEVDHSEDNLLDDAVFDSIVGPPDTRPAF